MAARKRPKKPRVAGEGNTPISATRRGVAAGSMDGATVFSGNHNRVYFPNGAAEQTGALRRRYLERVLQIARRLPLGDICPTAVSREAEAVELDEVYTPLATLDPEADDVSLVGGCDSRRDSWKPTAAERLLQHDRLMLIGDLGSGKTTFLNFVAMCFAAECLNMRDNRVSLRSLFSRDPGGADRHGSAPRPTPQSWTHGALLPIHIRLADFAA